MKKQIKTYKPIFKPSFKSNLIVAILVVLCLSARGQDPSFSQFFSSPLNLNPALTGDISKQWRAISNFRSQFAGPAYPYQTGTMSFDTKVAMKRIPEGHTLGFGTMMMYDRVMGGILKSSYASMNAAYDLVLFEGDVSRHHLGAGIGFIYGNRQVDFTRLVFPEQFAGNGFNTNLPTGEAALAQMAGYFSASAGMKYSIRGEFSNFDIGYSAFHLNKPRQTLIKDVKQILPVRQVIHSNFETYLNTELILSLNGVYMSQSVASYFSVGGALGRLLDDKGEKIINAGLWYWSKNAVVPYVGLVYKNMQFGLTYDVTISKLLDAPARPRTWEFSIIIRNGEPTETIPCPWK